MARKSGISVLPKVTFWLYFRSRSTARRARTIMARKSGISVLPKVTFWLYFLNSVPRNRFHTPVPAAGTHRTPGLPTKEDWRAFFQESRHAFLGIVGRDDASERRFLNRQSVVDRCIHATMYG